MRREREERVIVLFNFKGCIEPLRSEVEWAINQLPLGKSAGNDAIHGEMINASGEEGISIYHKL